MFSYSITFLTQQNLRFGSSAIDHACRTFPAKVKSPIRKQSVSYYFPHPNPPLPQNSPFFHPDKLPTNHPIETNPQLQKDSS
jgi:hypothetical protein